VSNAGSGSRAIRTEHARSRLVSIAVMIGVLLITICMGALAAQPVITGISITDAAMKINDTVTATISVQSDSATTYTLNSGAVGGYVLSLLNRTNSTTYTAQFTITAGGTDYAAGEDIPASISLEGTGTGTWSGLISQGSDPIDANRPTVTSIIRDDLNPTREAQVSIQVDFSESVSGVATSNFSIDASGGQTTASIASVGPGGSSAVWLVVLNTVDDATGTLSIDLDSNLSSITDNAGNALIVGLTAGEAYDVDRLDPTVSVTMSDDALIVGETSLVTFTFTEAVVDFDATDVSVQNGGIGAITVTGDPLVYTGTFTPTNDLEDATNVISAGIAWTDTVGNPPTGTSSSSNYTIDTKEPIVDVTMSDDALIVGETSLVTFTFTEAVVDFDATDVSVQDGGIGAVTVTGDPLVYTGTFTPTDDLEDATNVISAGIVWTDIAGNAPIATSDSPNYEIDTKEPIVVVTMSDDALIVGETSLVTFTFTEAVVDFDATDVSVENGGIGAVTVTGDPLVYTGTFTPTDDLEDATNVISAGIVWTDVAGNAPLTGDDSPNYAIDTKEPIVVVTMSDDALIVGETSLVTFTFTEAVVDFDATDVSVQNGGIGAVTVTGDPLVYTGTFTPTDDLEDATNVISAGIVWTDVAGNAPIAASDSPNYEIDTKEPTITGVSTNDSLITDADTPGDATFVVTIEFSEAMNTGIAPTVTFSPVIGTTLALDGTSGWLDSDTYEAKYDTADVGVDHDDVTVDVSGANDAAGNNQEDFTPTSEFQVDTLNPTILSITSITADGYYSFGSIDVTVTFSEAVTLSGGTLDITLDTPGDVVSVTGFTGWTDASTSYSIGAGDNSCDLDAIGIILNGGTLRDLAGNDAVVLLPGTTIAAGSDITVDTTDPVISGLDLPDTTQSVDAGCSITIPYSAQIDDNCCVNTGVGSSDVQVTVTIVGGSGSATLDAPAATIANNGINRIDISGSFTVSDVTGGDVDVQVEIDCLDCAGNSPAAVSDTVTIDDSTDPVISGFNLPDNTLYMDPALCTYTVPYSATIDDNCCLDAGNVSVVVELVAPYDTATLSAPAATIWNAGGTPNTQVGISGSFEVSALTNDPVHVRVRINATDCNGNAMTEASDTAVFEDGTAPTIGWNIDLPDSTQYVDQDTCIIVIPVQATVTDACCINAGNVTINVQLTNATLSHTVTATQVSQGVVDVSGDITVSALTGCPADLSITIDGIDCAGNHAIQLTDSAVIRDNTVPVINDLMFNTDDSYAAEMTIPYLVDECGLVVVYFSANVTDNCCIVPGNVNVTVTLPTADAILENIVINQVQNGQGRVDVTGNAVVRCLDGPDMSRVQIDISAADCCGNPATPDATGSGEGLVDDVILPIPLDDPRQDMVMDESAIIDPLVEVRVDEFGTYRLVLRESTPVRIDIMANDADNLSHNVAHPFDPCISCGPCGGQTGCCATMVIHEIVEHPSYGTADIEDDTGNCAGGTVIRYAPDRGYLGPDYFTYRTRDAFGNVSTEIATVYLQVVPEVWMEDVYVIACQGSTVEFDVLATDLFIDPENPSVIQFAFSITDGPEHGIIAGDLLDIVYTLPSMVTDPQFGVQVPSLDFSEGAVIALTYTPADGFVGRDQLRIRFEDPFGGVSIAIVDIIVGACGDATGSAIYVTQGQLLPMIVPVSFGPEFEAGMSAVRLISADDGTLFPDAMTGEWDEQINRHVLTLHTAELPPGSYQLEIPLGTGEIVTLTIEVGEAE